MKKSILAVILAVIVPASLFGQNDDVIIRAMKDELDRSMKELSMKDYDKPFYIAYTMEDRKLYSVTAQMGALVRSSVTPARSSNVRLLVGDYALNDETFDSNSGMNQGAEGNDIQLPVDNDYFGIRRSFWAMTDYVYKSAARQFKQNKQTLLEKKKPLDEVTHRSFAKMEPVTVMEEGKTFSVDLKELEKIITNTSSEFLRYPDLDNSVVYAYFSTGYKYFVNSEGTLAKIPAQVASVFASATYKTPQGEILNDEFVFYAETPSGLPSEEVIRKEIDVLYKRLKGKEKRGLLEDDYNGPVLFVGDAVNDLVAEIVRSEQSLFATDVLPDPKRRLYNDEGGNGENKLNRQIIHESLTLKARAKLKTFQGVSLLGAYSIDPDGVVPPDEIVLIEAGVLKNQLNDRSLIQPYERANGHANRAAVLELSTTKGMTVDALKAKLIERGKAEDLPFVLMVSIPDHGDGSVKIVTRINLKDGREEVIRGANVSFLATKDLKKVGGAADKLHAANFSSGETGFVSVIAPDALLLNSVEVRKTTPSFLKEEDYVTNPLLD